MTRRRARPPEATIEAFRRLYAGQQQRVWVFMNTLEQFRYQALPNDVTPPEFWRSSPNSPPDRTFKLHGWLDLGNTTPPVTKQQHSHWLDVLVKLLGSVLAASFTLFLAIAGLGSGRRHGS